MQCVADKNTHLLETALLSCCHRKCNNKVKKQFTKRIHPVHCHSWYKEWINSLLRVKNFYRKGEREKGQRKKTAPTHLVRNCSSWIQTATLHTHTRGRAWSTLWRWNLLQAKNWKRRLLDFYRHPSKLLRRTQVRNTEPKPLFLLFFVKPLVA